MRAKEPTEDGPIGVKHFCQSISFLSKSVSGNKENENNAATPNLPTSLLNDIQAKLASLKSSKQLCQVPAESIELLVACVNGALQESNLSRVHFDNLESQVTFVIKPTVQQDSMIQSDLAGANLILALMNCDELPKTLVSEEVSEVVNPYSRLSRKSVM